MAGRAYDRKEIIFTMAKRRSIFTAVIPAMILPIEVE